MKILIYCVENAASFLTMALCWYYFCITEAELNKKRSLISIVIFAALLPPAYILKYTDIISSDLATVIYIPLFFAQYFVSLSVLFGRARLRLLYVAVLVELLTEHISVGVRYIFNFPDSDFITDFSARMLLFLLVFLFLRKTDRAKNSAAIKLIPRHIFVLFMLSIILMSGLITLNSYQVSAEKAILKTALSNSIIIILTVIMAVILMSLLFNVIAKHQSESTAKLLSEQVESQIRHYDRLEKLDNEMRRFRHDYTNHLQSIRSLISLGEYSEAEDYIAKLQNEKPKASNIFYTGSKLADAIMSDKAFSLPDNVRIEFQGLIPPGIDNTDLCVLLSNALDNAAEACRDSKDDCVISVSSEVKSGYLVLTISNPVPKEMNLNGIPRTTKPDTLNHGLGLVNIRQTAARYDGQININCSNGKFELTILLKI